MSTAHNPVQRILVIAGPTASGKTTFAHDFAIEYGGEIINADSRQVYKFLDIGTAKPTYLQQKQVQYHLLDLVTPEEVFTLGQFLYHANLAIREIRNRGKLPIIVGGSGQYIHGLVNGWNPPAVSPDISLRANLNSLTIEELQNRLKAVDPVSATKIHPNNIRRVIRALEVYYTLGRPFSSFQTPDKTSNKFMNICVEVDQTTLHQQIDQRIEDMLVRGWKTEIQALLNSGYSASDSGFSSLGYRNLIDVIQGRASMETAVASIQIQTKQLARRQKQWFTARRFEIASKRVDDIDIESLYNDLARGTGAIT
jgi:tRNA dimethylallyltransferase